MRWNLPALRGRWPVTVWLFAAIVLLWQLAFLLFDQVYVDKHLVALAVWTPIGLGSLAALVGWRQRWAWWLFLSGPVLYWVSPAWGAPFHPLWDLAELVIAGLLLSPSMRRHVFSQGARRQRFRARRPWTVPLALSGVLTVAIAVPVRHPVEHTIASRVVMWTLFWLLLAAAMRLVAYVVRRIGGLFERRAENPPTGSQS